MLEKLFHTMPAHTFLEQYWLRRALVAHGSLDRLAGLSDLVEWLDIDALLELSSTRVVSFYVGPDGKFRGLPTEARVAHRLFKDLGATICLSAIHRDPNLSCVHDTIYELSTELGVAPASATINAYASPPGGGLVAHWDATEAFIVQLRGAKRWRYAPNEYVKWPTENYVCGGPVPLEVQKVIDDGKNPIMPVGDEVESATLEAGSVLYVPRGFWHATEAGGESLSIAIKFEIPIWADLVVKVLSAQLRASPEWRQPVVGISDPGFDNSAVASRLSDILNTHVEGPLNLSASNIDSLLALLSYAGTQANLDVSN